MTTNNSILMLIITQHMSCLPEILSLPQDYTVIDLYLKKKIKHLKTIKNKCFISKHQNQPKLK